MNAIERNSRKAFAGALVWVFISPILALADDRMKQRAVDLLLTGQAEEALELLRPLHLEGTDGDASFYFARALKRLGKKKAAKTALTELLQRQPGHFQASVDMAVFELESGDAEAAKKRLLFLQPLTQEDRGVHAYHMGLALQQLGDFEASKTSFAKAAKSVDGLKVPGLYYQAVSMQKLGDSPSAIEALSEVEHLDRDGKFGEKARQLMDQIEGRTQSGKRRFNFFGSLGAQYDTNVILEPDSVNISDEDDFRGVAFLSASFTWSPVQVGYSVYQSMHLDLDDFNVQNHSGSLNWKVSKEPSGRILSYGSKNTVNVAFLSNSIDFYSFSAASSPYVKRQVNSVYTVSLEATYKYEDFRGADSLRDNMTFSLLHGHKIKLSWMTFFLKQRLSFQDAGQQYDLLRGEGDINMTKSFSAADFGVQLGFIHDLYGRNTLFREDNRYFVGGNIARQLNRNFRVAAGYQRFVNNSNLALFDYTRDIFSLNFLGFF